MKILVISPCSASQKHKKLANKLRIDDFISTDPNHLPRRIEELDEYKESAISMYQGGEHQLIRNGLESIRNTPNYGVSTVDLYIISTGFGLICENQKIVPYNVPNNNSHILKGNGSEKLHNEVKNKIKDYNLVFFILGKTYVQALRLPFDISDTVSQIFIIYKRTQGYSQLIPNDLPNCFSVELNSKDFKSGYTAKGLVFNKLCEAACEQGFGVFEQVKENPEVLLDIVQ